VSNTEKLNIAMEIKRVYQLTQREFDALKGTELYALLVARKFSVTLPASASAISALEKGQDLARFVEMYATGPWYVCTEMQSGLDKYTFFFSNDEDTCFFEKDVLK
jgi:hypothetical protein